MTTLTVADRDTLIGQADAVLAWIREHSAAVVSFSIQMVEDASSLMVSFNETVGAEHLAGLIPWDPPAGPWPGCECPKVKDYPDPASGPIARTSYGQAFGGISVSVYAWRPGELVALDEDDEPDRIADVVTLRVVGDRL